MKEPPKIQRGKGSWRVIKKQQGEKKKRLLFSCFHPGAPEPVLDQEGCAGKREENAGDGKTTDQNTQLNNEVRRLTAIWEMFSISKLHPLMLFLKGPCT